eukprot:EG_transcript_26238
MPRRGVLMNYAYLTSILWGWWASHGVDKPALFCFRFLLQMKPYLIFAPYIVGALISMKINNVNRAMLTLMGLPLSLLLLSLLPLNYWTTVHVFPVLTKEECEWILSETRAHVEERGWHPLRQRFYPAAETSTHHMPEVHELLYEKMYQKSFASLIEQQYQGPNRATPGQWGLLWTAPPPRSRGGTREVGGLRRGLPAGIFVVEYRTDTQPGVPPHVDMGELSWIIQLNDPATFTGGGTHFVGHNK